MSGGGPLQVILIMLQLGYFREVIRWKN